MSITSKDDLKKKQIEARKKSIPYTCRILVCSGTGCVASGSRRFMMKCQDSVRELTAYEVNAERCTAYRNVIKTGCQGLCELGPLGSYRTDRSAVCTCAGRGL